MNKIHLKLYIVGQTPNSRRAMVNIKKICAEELEGQYQLEIIDVLENPQLAEEEDIIATPTLIKVMPLPRRRVIGDLSDTEKVLLGLYIYPHSQDVDNIGGYDNG